MEFDWLEPTAPSGPTIRDLDVLRDEVKKRAAMLYRLGHESDVVVARCRQNLRWEHGERSLIDAEVESLVASVHNRTLTLQP